MRSRGSRRPKGLRYESLFGLATRLAPEGLCYSVSVVSFVVNVSGSLALGVVVGLMLEHGLAADVRTVVGTGFLGAYTTFSTYAYETIRAAEDGHRETAVAYALGSVVAAVAAAAFGLVITGAW